MSPTILNDLTLPRLLAAVVVIVAGYPLHELCHAAVLWLSRTPFEVEIAPSDRPDWLDILVGRAVAITPARELTPPLGLAFVLAPGVLTLPAVYLWIQMLQADVISLSSALFVGAWFIVFLPSALDWYHAVRCVRRL